MHYQSFTRTHNRVRYTFMEVYWYCKFTYTFATIMRYHSQSTHYMLPLPVQAN